MRAPALQRRTKGEAANPMKPPATEDVGEQILELLRELDEALDKLRGPGAGNSR